MSYLYAALAVALIAVGTVAAWGYRAYAYNQAVSSARLQWEASCLKQRGVVAGSACIKRDAVITTITGVK